MTRSSNYWDRQSADLPRGADRSSMPRRSARVQEHSFASSNEQKHIVLTLSSDDLHEAPPWAGLLVYSESIRLSHPWRQSFSTQTSTVLADEKAGKFPSLGSSQVLHLSRPVKTHRTRQGSVHRRGRRSRRSKNGNTCKFVNPCGEAGPECLRSRGKERLSEGGLPPSRPGNPQ